jgi:nucleotide-binding universal stress UspA family protein
LTVVKGQAASARIIGTPHQEQAMSGIRQILALLTDGPRADAVLALAAHLARQQGAGLSALHAVEPVVTGAYLAPEAAATAIQLAEQADIERREVAAERVTKAAALQGLTIPFAATTGDPLRGSLRHARNSDLVVLAQRTADDGTAAGFAPGLLVRTGRPLLFVPSVDTLPTEADGSLRCGRRVIVAWAPTRESTRALHDALPLLAKAERVELVRLARPDDETEGEPMEAVRDHLLRHGVKATLQPIVRKSAPLETGLGTGWTPDVPVAEALLSHAADTDADLIVMGGYGHARAWELVLGGVTRTMLASMTVPVLMSH